MMDPLKIAYIAAGAGGMYCGNCLHDTTLAKALIDLGHDVLLIPTYTPVKTDEENVTIPKIFYGGLNVYLQQKYAIFRATPWLFDWFLDRPWLISWLTSFSVSVRGEDLGALAVSVLQGEHGQQRKELDKLVTWLTDEVKPDVIHLSNGLFVGMAREMQKRVGVPVACTLAGEDLFLEELKEPHTTQARDLLRERSRDVAAFVASNQYYAQKMGEFLEVDADRVVSIPHGLNLQGHGHAHGLRNDDPQGTFRLGYLGRIVPAKGIHLLVDAFLQLCREPGLPLLKLRLGGYLGGAEKKYLADLEAKIRAAGFADRYEYAGELDRAGKIAFLQGLDVLAMPTVHPESKGLPVLEALANGVPVVVPAHGAFPEMIEDTQGGLLCAPHDASSLAQALRRLIDEPALRQQLADRGRKAVHERYSAREMARRTVELYRTVLSRQPGTAVARVAPAVSGN